MPRKLKDNEVKVDLDYKKNALKTDYDIESMIEIFTLAMINDHSLSFIMLADEQFDDLTDEMIIDQMKAFATKPSNLKLLDVDDPNDLDYNLYRFHSNVKEDKLSFEKLMRTIIACSVFTDDKYYVLENNFQKQFAEYCGWNSFSYDLPLMILIKLFCGKSNESLFEAKYFRQLSNLLIEFNDRPYKFSAFVESQMRENPENFGGIVIRASEYKLSFNTAIWSDGHIDWAKLGKSVKDEGNLEETKFPPSLKKENAKNGLDIIIDDLIKEDKEHIWLMDEKLHLVIYNFNDVLGQRSQSRNSVIQGQLSTLDEVRAKFPYTSARFADPSTLSKYQPPERDITSASLSGYTIVGPNRIKPKDWDFVKYRFPVPKSDGSGEFVFVDLLEYIMEKESFVPPEFYAFFNHFRGKNTKSKYDNWKAKVSQPISNDSKLVLPYFRCKQAIDCSITLSTGGAHGFIFAGLSKKTPEELFQIMKTSVGPSDLEKPTADISNILHLDWDSFYPMMASKMEIFMTDEGIDRFSQIMYDRFDVKKLAGKLLKSANYNKLDKDYIEANEYQLALKLIINACTGAANQHNPYALMPLDNKILSMRLIGNMLIWTLAQRLVEAGAFILSTNTDGLYICNLNIDEAQPIVDQYVKDYGMGVEPEEMKRFINRDASNRVEFEHDVNKISVISGTMTPGEYLKFPDTLIGKNVKFPLASANAMVRYMVDDVDWLKKEYDRSRLENYIKEMSKDTTNTQPWYIVNVNSSANKLTLNDEPQQYVNRIILTKDGKTLGNLNNSALKNIDAVSIWNAVKNGKMLEDICKMEGSNGEVYNFDEKFVDYCKSNQGLVNLTFSRKLSKNEKAELSTDSEYLPIDDFLPSGNLTEDDLKNVKKQVKATSIKLTYEEEKGIFSPVKHWKKNKLGGYPSLVGDVYNLTDDLDNFDFNKLDLDAYVDWAEQLLDNWKITADIEELGLTFSENSHITKKSKRKSNKTMDFICDLYGIPPMELW